MYLKWWLRATILKHDIICITNKYIQMYLNTIHNGIKKNTKIIVAIDHQFDIVTSSQRRDAKPNQIQNKPQ